MHISNRREIYFYFIVTFDLQKQQFDQLQIMELPKQNKSQCHHACPQAAEGPKTPPQFQLLVYPHTILVQETAYFNSMCSSALYLPVLFSCVVQHIKNIAKGPAYTAPICAGGKISYPTRAAVIHVIQVELHDNTSNSKQGFKGHLAAQCKRVCSFTTEPLSS